MKHQQVTHLDSLRKAFLSFNIAPKNTYDRYTAILKHSDTENAISSDFYSVGNDIRSAISEARK